MRNEKYYQLVLLWITDAMKFQDYLQKMAPVVTRYGGAGDRSFQPSAIWAEGMDLPQVVNLVHYDSKEAYQNFNNDPDFKQIEHLRSESTKIISYEGYLRVANRSVQGLNEREYNIEIVSYKNGSPLAYSKYELEGEGKMREFGFDVEFILDLESKSSEEKQPHMAKVSYFNNAGCKMKFEKDAAHKEIEALYPSTIDSVIWISAKIHPMTIKK
jgi:uncharacterized protein (DUF1330 family)